MKRTRLRDRILPNYTRREELFNMISHIVGGGLGVFMLLSCVIVASWNQNVWGIASGAVYCFSVVLLYTMSSIYHGLTVEMPKKVFQVFDHCTIFILIAGTYTPVLLCKFREVYPVDAWVMFGVIWGLAVLGIVLNSIDLKRYSKFSMICYLGMGWCIVVRIRQALEVLGTTFFMFLLVGGLFYTIGAAFYAVGKKKKYMHSVFHIFVNLATLAIFFGIVIFIMPAK